MTSSNSKIPRKIKPEGADGHRQRMIFKFLNSYENGFLKRDLVEILLYYAIRIRDTRDTAVRLMKDNGDDIYNVLSATHEKLCLTPGVGQSCALLINVAGEIIRRMGEDDTSADCQDDKLESSLGAVETLVEMAKTCNHERLYVAFHSDSRINSYKSFVISLSNKLSGEIEFLLKQACLTHSEKVSIIRATRASPAPSSWDMELYHSISHALASTDMRLDEYYIISKEQTVKMKNVYM